MTRCMLDSTNLSDTLTLGMGLRNSIALAAHVRVNKVATLYMCHDDTRTYGYDNLSILLTCSMYSSMSW